ncbi:uncharacterized protein NECHADRAFT_87690 [Fusarium vanettenii 77-13-4]|uniref:Heterokaryon incompatibility domain-containing protein n=1 Tax=Fusarium vanettenii (strain ATCC MYA-4622 / CBS 123669 / FGSC 9596 / NRRL 45880 / 77-13-4) TaxID=660122 RepID=C7Z2R5_FUSV7|nr:uncharacterized protein NECHADRAFT_87690 [Fusarium vanettenii 77-13-4]EEU41709.1 hypothetical protein NECHADRAFT_87690 [Fusarium vanettenii 77-13-4]
MASCTCSTRKGPISLTERPSPPPETTSEHLCAQCASLDLNALLQSRDPEENNARPWLRSTMGSACPLCRFLATIASPGHPSPSPSLDTEIEYQLETVSFPHGFRTFSENDVQDKSIYDFNVLGLCTFYSFLPEGCILPVDYNLQHPKLPAIRKIDAASINFSILRNWLVHCQTHHSASCIPLDQYLLQEVTGLKLIDCETRQVVEAPRDPIYVALSYVWGKSHAAEATGLSRSSLPEIVPRTIEDAIQVVLRLGLKYLWVDKYCINQSNATELAQQISIMDMIYNAAFCTIIAACGEDASFGLPGVGLTRRPKQRAIHLNGQFWVSSLRAPDLVTETSTWASRGWTYQEGLFSRRRLIFTEEQVYFECNATTCLETVSYDLHCQTDTTYLGPGGIFNGGLGYGGDELHWRIREYSKRSLSFQSDIINALSGVFRLYSTKHHPTHHYWGVPIYYHSNWDSSLPNKSVAIDRDLFRQFGREIDAAFARGLCWQLGMPCPRRRDFPSWSWSGWIGPLADSNWLLNSQLGDKRVKIWLQRTNGYTPALRIEAWVIDTTLTYLAHGLNGACINRTGWIKNPRYFVSAEALASRRSFHGTLRWLVVPSVQVKEGDEMHEELCRETFTCVLLSKVLEFALVVRKRAGEVVERIGHVRISPAVVDPGYITKDYELYEDADMFDIFPRTRRTRRTILLG